MGGIIYRGVVQISYEEIEATLYNLQECPKAHDNLITSKGVKMGELVYAFLGELKDEVLKEIPRWGCGIFVDTRSICAFFNMQYTSDSSFH